MAYAENQSMFLDSLISDGDWLARYAKSRCASPRCSANVRNEARSRGRRVLINIASAKEWRGAAECREVEWPGQMTAPSGIIRTRAINGKHRF